MQTAAFCSEPRTVKKHVKTSVSPSLSMYQASWEEELAEDPDRECFLHGLQHGFDIIDPNASPSPVFCHNHPSAKPGSPLYDQACQQVQKEIDMGHYEIVTDPPSIVSPMGVIPNSDGGVRLIYDCSRPSDSWTVNEYCTTKLKQKFSRVDEAAALVTKGCFMAKIDLKNAFRSVKISKHSQTVTGLQWQFRVRTVFLRDTRLPFGSTVAPGILHRLSQAVRRMLRRRGLTAVVVYLDDFFIKADSFHDCVEALNITISLLRKVGLSINWQKVIDPSTIITFLGIETDSVDMCLRLPDEKLVQVREELARFQGIKKAAAIPGRETEFLRKCRVWR